MIHRAIFDELTAHLVKPQATVITGMRRVGKSTALRFLLDKVPHQNKVYLDLERAEYRFILNQTNYKDIEINLSIEGIDFSSPAVIALDEIQLVPQIPSVMKYLYDTYNVKFIVSGSSSYYLKNRFSESLAGRKQIFEMYPLDFAEFVSFRKQNDAALRKFANQPFQLSFYLKWKELYEEFLRFGGFPEVVLAETAADKRSFIKDLINAYIELDIRLLSDFSASDDLLRLIRLLAVRSGNRVDYSKLSVILGINRNKLKDYIHLLHYTYFIMPVTVFSNNPDREVSKQQKMYLSDTGILQELAQVSSGQVFENAIALQLSRLGKIQYYQKLSGQEIDFILDGKTAIEVKETPTEADFHQLRTRSKSIGIEHCQLIGRHQPASGFSDFYWGGSIM
jgi:predicted AAA+ superfamily ATPase